MAAQGYLLLILDLSTSWGEWSASRTCRALPPGKGPVPIGLEAGWASELVWTQMLEEKSPCLWRGSNLVHTVVQSVARQYTDFDITAPSHDDNINLF
jgi:hypothetical protein